MAKPQQVPYTKADLVRAFRLFADRGAPPGCIAPETLEQALVSWEPSGVCRAICLYCMVSIGRRQVGYCTGAAIVFKLPDPRASSMAMMQRESARHHSLGMQMLVLIGDVCLRPRS